MNSLSILPTDYDIGYIIRKANVLNHFGYEAKEDGIHFRYLTSDYDAVQAVIDAYPVDYANDVLKERMWENVKTIRAQKEALPAPTPLGPVDTDDRSKIKILGLVQMAVLSLQSQQPFEEEFTMADNSVVLLSAADAITLGKASGRYVSQVYARARALRAAINAAADINELAAIDIEADWPA